MPRMRPGLLGATAVALTAGSLIAPTAFAQAKAWPDAPPAAAAGAWPAPARAPAAAAPSAFGNGPVAPPAGAFGAAPAAPPGGAFGSAPPPQRSGAFDNPGPAPSTSFGSPAGAGAGGFGGGPPGAGGFGAPPGAGGQAGAPPKECEGFFKLKDETDKRAAAAKALGQRKAAREEMCKAMQGFATAIGKWAKFTKDNSAKCGIPGQVGEQLKAGYENITKNTKQVCDGGGVAAGPPGPRTLSEALGTLHDPVVATPQSSRPSTGTLNTLTGTAITR